jgi:hypothetical protein
VISFGALYTNQCVAKVKNTPMVNAVALSGGFDLCDGGSAVSQEGAGSLRHWTGAPSVRPVRSKCYDTAASGNMNGVVRQDTPYSVTITLNKLCRASTTLLLASLAGGKSFLYGRCRATTSRKHEYRTVPIYMHLYMHYYMFVLETYSIEK